MIRDTARRYNVTLDPDVAARLDRQARRRRQHRSHLIEEIIRAWLDDRDPGQSDLEEAIAARART